MLLALLLPLLVRRRHILAGDDHGMPYHVPVLVKRGLLQVAEGARFRRQRLPGRAEDSVRFQGSIAPAPTDTHRHEYNVATQKSK